MPCVIIISDFGGKHESLIQGTSSKVEIRSFNKANRFMGDVSSFWRLGKCTTLFSTTNHRTVDPEKRCRWTPNVASTAVHRNSVGRRLRK